jgi:6-phosphogluconolactonase
VDRLRPIAHRGRMTVDGRRETRIGKGNGRPTVSIPRLMQVRIFNGPEALADAAAAEVAGWLSLGGNGRTIGLAGGSTPRRAYELMAHRGIPWRNVHGWMTDERHVPTDHPDSNAGMVRAALFDHVPATLHEVPWDEDAPAAARRYEEELSSLLVHGQDGLQPGMVMLGVGEDGHTASLFPGSEAVDITDRDYVAVEVPGIGWRLTATVGLLTRARRILFLVSGEHKAAVLAEILEGDSMLPAAVVARGARDAPWLFDLSAASQVEERRLGF